MSFVWIFKVEFVPPSFSFLASNAEQLLRSVSYWGLRLGVALSQRTDEDRLCKYCRALAKEGERLASLLMCDMQ